MLTQEGAASYNGGNDFSENGFDSSASNYVRNEVQRSIELNGRYERI